MEMSVEEGKKPRESERRVGRKERRWATADADALAAVRPVGVSTEDVEVAAVEVREEGATEGELAYLKSLKALAFLVSTCDVCIHVYIIQGTLGTFP